MASDSSELLVLSMQHESTQMYWKPFFRASAHAERIFGESSGSSHVSAFESEQLLVESGSAETCGKCSEGTSKALDNGRGVSGGGGSGNVKRE